MANTERTRHEIKINLVKMFILCALMMNQSKEGGEQTSSTTNGGGGSSNPILEDTD